MVSWVDTFLVMILMLNLFALGTSRIRSIIRSVGLQGILIGLLPLIVHETESLAAVALALVSVATKGLFIPWMLQQALRKADIKREVEPLIGLLPSMTLGAVATVFAVSLSSSLPSVQAGQSDLLAPTALATVLVGFLLLVTRYKAITQVIGYLILENGIFIFGMLLMDAMPLIVELGIILDLLVGMFVICIILNHISRAFSSMDTRELSKLREDV